MTLVTKKSLVSVSLVLQKWFTEVCVFKERDSKNDDCSNVNVCELGSSIQYQFFIVKNLVLFGLQCKKV